MKKRKKIYLFLSVLLIVFTFGFVSVGAYSADSKNWPMPSEWEEYNYNKLFISDKTWNSFGLDFTLDNGILTINGTSTYGGTFKISDLKIEGDIYSFSTEFYNGSYVFGDTPTLQFSINDVNDNSLSYRLDNGNVFKTYCKSLVLDNIISFTVLIGKGVTFNNAKFKFMLLNDNYTVDNLPLFMPNLNFLVDEVGNQAFNTGYNVGKSEGYSEGYSVGKLDGYNGGYGVGYDDGYKEGVLNGSVGGIFYSSVIDIVKYENGSFIVGRPFVNDDYINNGFLNSIVGELADSKPGSVVDNKIGVTITFSEPIDSNAIILNTCCVDRLAVEYSDGLGLTLFIPNSDYSTTNQTINFSLLETLPVGNIRSFTLFVNDYTSFIIGSTTNSNKQYNLGFNKGYNLGKNKGYSEGYDKGYDDGYNFGFIEGENSVEVNDNYINFTFANLLETIFLFPVKFLTEGMNVEIFGINIGSVVLGVMCFSLLIFVIEFLKKYFK